MTEQEKRQIISAMVAAAWGAWCKEEGGVSLNPIIDASIHMAEVLIKKLEEREKDAH